MSVRMLRRVGLQRDFDTHEFTITDDKLFSHVFPSAEHLYTITSSPVVKTAAVFADSVVPFGNKTPEGFIAREGSTHGVTANYFSGSLTLCDLLHC